MGRLIDPHSPLSYFPALSHTLFPSQGLAPGYYRAFFVLLNEEFSIAYHGPVQLLQSLVDATMLCANEEQSRDGAQGAALLFATACTQLLFPLQLCFFPGSCAITALAAARVCNHKVLLER